MVGTRCVCVTPCSCTSRSVSSASHASMSTIPTPYTNGSESEGERRRVVQPAAQVYVAGLVAEDRGEGDGRLVRDRE